MPSPVTRHPAPRSRGFTLTELLMVVTILGILSSMAFVRYERTLERGRWQTARDIVQTIYSGEIVYWTANNLYFAPGVWSTIYMDDPNGALPVTFTVAVDNVANPPTFTATATRNGGPCNGETQTVDQAHVFGGVWKQSGACP